ncbi:MAG: endolytic transglycosylase MltG, partial [Pseudomonadota bacterium]|nr:endolytic transglycosylase MltG [Pseudomonadota bacterium]
MLSFLKRLVLLATVIVLAAAGGVVWWAQQPVSLAASPLEVVIKPNSSVVSVGKQLANAGVGVQPQLFSLVARATGNAKSLKAGGYALETGATPMSILDKMARGDVTHYVVTVIEGWSMRQMRAVVDAEPALKHDTAGLSDADLMR